MNTTGCLAHEVLVRKLHPDEITIDEALVRGLLARQFRSGPACR